MTEWETVERGGGEGERGAGAGGVAGTGCHRSYQVRRIRRPCAVFGVEKYLCCLAEQQKEKEERGVEGAGAGGAGLGA